MSHTLIPSYQNPVALDRSQIPKPIFDEQPEYVDFYWLAWEQAWNHVVHNDMAAQSPYMDEGCRLDRIWIWDTCFMVLFARYASRVFPGVESLNNFYAVMYDGVESSLAIHHLDNPPLFAWCELAYFQHTGDTARIHHILKEKQYLQKHYECFGKFHEQFHPGSRFPAITLRETPLGYHWDGNASGMDNTPRGFDRYESILWVDALAQQALSAYAIAHLAKQIDEHEIASHYHKEHRRIEKLLNTYYWDDEDGFYYDILADAPHTHVKVKTPASYWPLLAGVCNQQQASALCEHATNPEVFGGRIPWPSVARSGMHFDQTGRYWRGGIWMPTAYMAIKALESAGFTKEADASADDLLRHMYETWRNFEPHTIWETYSPVKPMPAEGKKPGVYVRPDFCGWSALGPISLLIENVLGFRQLDASKRTIHWDIRRTSRHGIENLRVGDIHTNLLYENGRIHIYTNRPFNLVAKGTKIPIPQGDSVHSL